MHPKDVTEKADSCPLFLTQNKSRSLVSLVSIGFLESKPIDELIN
jgi:hypothetical protein